MPSASAVHIYGDRGRLIAVVVASDAKQALVDYYHDHLKERGYESPSIKGNKMSVSLKGFKKHYLAKMA